MGNGTNLPVMSADGCGGCSAFGAAGLRPRLCACPEVCVSACCLMVRRLAAMVLRRCGVSSGGRSRIGPVVAVSIVGWGWVAPAEAGSGMAFAGA